ncbi:MAG: hypothetical protein ABI411_05140 [Tahibacter sp.]
MRVERTRQIDTSDPDENGLYEYTYEYDIYRFTDGTVSFVARSYTESPEDANFLHIEVDGKRRLLIDSDLKHPLLIAANAYLVRDGKSRLSWLRGVGGSEELLASGPSDKA